MNFKTLDRTWIVAEIGVNHQGDEAVAADMIRRAAAAGVDAVKFQTYRTEQFVSSSTDPARLARVRRFELSCDAFRRLAQVADAAGVTFFSTPLDFESVDFLNQIAPLFKIASGDLTHLALIRHVARKRKPMIVSTGLGLEDEISAAVDAILAERPDIRDKGELMLMHCVSAYPTPAEQANLRNLGWLARTFDLPVGYSDHTLGIKACELAVAAGALALEKHFTYRKEDQAFHDHALSADAKDMESLIAAVRTAERFLGRQSRRRGHSESENLNAARRSLAAAVEIGAGEPIREEWITWLRPGTGLPPSALEKLVGRRLKRNVKAGELIFAGDIAD